VSDEPAQYVYCFDHEWVPGMAGTAINPLDPALGIDWPLPIDTGDRSQISARDRRAAPAGRGRLTGRRRTGTEAGTW
jgi:dTDP-4-dehydrorhamnose 3,5-epimerase